MRSWQCSPRGTHVLRWPCISATERDLRAEPCWALGRFSLDCALRAHGRAHATGRTGYATRYESLLVDDPAPGGICNAPSLALRVQGLLGFGLARAPGGLSSRGGEASGALLLTYWALRIPALGQELMLLPGNTLAIRNTTLASLEPLEHGRRGTQVYAEPAAASAPPIAPAKGLPLLWRE